MDSDATAIIAQHAGNEDPLASDPDSPASPSSADVPDRTTASTTKPPPAEVPTYSSPEELLALVSERLVVEPEDDDDDEMVDPIERAVRFLVPIPKHYYWDVVVASENKNAADDLQHIPTRIKWWHRGVAASVAAGDWTHRWIARPVANALGLTGSRFHFVTDFMTERDMEESRRIVEERRLGRRDREMSETVDAGGSGNNKEKAAGNAV